MFLERLINQLNKKIRLVISGILIAIVLALGFSMYVHSEVENDKWYLSYLSTEAVLMIDLEINPEINFIAVEYNSNIDMTSKDIVRLTEKLKSKYGIEVIEANSLQLKEMGKSEGSKLIDGILVKVDSINTFFSTVFIKGTKYTDLNDEMGFEITIGYSGIDSWKLKKVLHLSSY